MIRRRWPLLVMVVAALAAAALYAWPRSRTVDAAFVVRGDVTQSVVASGRVATPARIAVSSQIAARIERILVREGDRVGAGQALVRLRTQEAEAVLAAARAALAEAKGRLRQQAEVQRPLADQQLAQSRAVLTQAGQDLARARELHARGFVSQARIDEAERALAVARAGELSARAQADANRERGLEQELARLRLEQAQANLETAQARLELLVLRAPADATVLTRVAEEGDTAQVGRTVLELAQAGETRIIATVDEKNLRHLRPGLKASALADAFPSAPFDAEVVYVAPAIDAQRGTVEVRLRVDRPPEFLRPDMTVSVEMLAGRRESTLLLPAEAVRGAEGAGAWVLAARDGRAVEVPVATGLRGVGVVEILSGLREGDAAILPTAPAVAGQRVRAAVPAPKRTGTGLQPVPGLTN